MTLSRLTCCLLFLEFFSCLPYRLMAQENYFQQAVHYTISVTLDDSAHTLRGDETVKYVNNSPFALDTLWFHLWPNAYESYTTALGQQLLHRGSKLFYYAGESDRGYIRELDFRGDGKPLRWEYHPRHRDICYLLLPSALKAGDSILITTPFYVKIPSADFSRLGHSGQAYFITQWYPKPAVFDREGWHPMPYLDQGEFYSEFGSFDVRITLPDNYMLAATGDRIDAQVEEQRLLEREELTKAILMETDVVPETGMDFPRSSATLKTVRFVQQKVHDFAWFADKRFLVLSGEIRLPASGRKVSTYVFFTPKNRGLWKDAVEYVNHSTLFYSGLLGDYPYNHVTAVDGTIMAGGGMEYPNITVIGDAAKALDLDLVITHEVGHNWFYGILASNERRYPFLDEGLNSFYETRYLRTKYPNERLGSFLGFDSSARVFGLHKTPYWRYHEVFYNFLKSYNRDQPLDLPATDYNELGYGGIIYSKTPVVLDYLMEYAGEQRFDAAMKTYYEKFKFRHPGPDDLFNTLQEALGLDMTKFRRHFVSGTSSAGYGIRRIRRNADGSHRLLIVNKGKADLPFNIFALEREGVSGVLWSEGFHGRRWISFPTVSAEAYKIDGYDRMPDRDRRDNFMRSSGLFRRARPLQVSFLTRMNDPRRRQVSYVPVTGYNYYNGWMLGLMLHNYSVYRRPLQFALVPLFDFRTGEISGLGDVEYHFRPGRILSDLSIGVRGRRFAYRRISDQQLADGTAAPGFFLHYSRISPYLNFALKTRRPGIRHQFALASHQIETDSAHFSPSTFLYDKRTKRFAVNELEYACVKKDAFASPAFLLTMHQSGTMLKVSGTLDVSPRLLFRKRWKARIFAGAFATGTRAEREFFAFRASGWNGYQDYLYQQHYFARWEGSGFGFSQFAELEGAMKVWTPFYYSRKWMAALNLKTPRVWKLPLRVYADFVASPANPGNLPLLWNAGFNLTLVSEVLDIYVPLAFSPVIRDALELNQVNGLQRVRFSFNLQRLEPKRVIRRNILE